jgi:hypothetical protein
MRSVCASVIVALLALGSSAFACHVSGAVYCDENTNGVIDIPGDLPIPGVTIGATSLDLGSGQYTATTDGNGGYDIALPTQSDRYLVGPLGLPAVLTVVMPSGGTYTAQIVVNTAQDHVDGLDFLVQGCAPTTSTTTTTTTSSTTTTTIERAFQCYEVDHAKFSLSGVNLSNEFGTSVAALSRPKRLCNPASIDGEDPAAPGAPAHLLGYSVVQTSPPPTPIQGVPVTNALGSFVVEVLRPMRLLVPSAKSLTDPPPPLSASDLLDHYECYRVRGAGPKNSSSIAMQDQFVTTSERIMQLQQLCVPVDVNGSGITNPLRKLMCYRTKYTGARFRGPGTPVFVNDEFGAATLQVSHGEEVCLPSSPSGAFVDGRGERADAPVP